MSSSPDNKLPLPNKKDSSVAVVIGQQRRTSDTHDKVAPLILTTGDSCKRRQNCVDKSDKEQSSLVKTTQPLEVRRSDHNKKKFLISEILQQKTHQEQAIPASQNLLHPLSLLTRGTLKILH